MAEKKINVAVIGLGFGKEFIPIYQSHKNVGKVAICARNHDAVKEAAKEFTIEDDMCFTNFDDVLNCKEIDAIHVVTPIFDHFRQSFASLEAGKHTACTVPMATTAAECKALVRARNKVNKVYMMMETSIYSREYLYVKDLVDHGKLGRIQFVRGSHMQNMGLKGWPEYWLGLPPMWYGTHAISPLLAINKTRAESVVCHGSGSVGSELAARYGSPFAVETATFKLKDTEVVAEATRSLFETVRQYRESFDIYGDKQAFEWDQIAEEGQVLFEGGETARRFHVPDTDAVVSEELKKYTLKEAITDQQHVSFIQGSGHGGSHPHLVQEFIGAIVEGRKAAVDAVESANYTCAGIYAHESAMNGAQRIQLPGFEAL